MRIEAWNRIARELDHDKLAAMTSTIPLDGVLEAGQEIVAGRIKGRVVVEIGCADGLFQAIPIGMTPREQPCHSRKDAQRREGKP